jgi:hypothetical protein
MVSNRQCSSASVASSTSSYGFDPEIDELMATMDLQDESTEEELMRDQIAVYDSDPARIEALLLLFMSLPAGERAVCLFSDEAFDNALQKARKILRSQALAPGTAITPRPRAPAEGYVLYN